MSGVKVSNTVYTILIYIYSIIIKGSNKLAIIYKENELYCCDNLDLLREIPNDSIDLIYCDVLYGTGKKFKNYKDIKDDENTVRNFYVNRLSLMRDKLKDNGSIYIHVDTRINYLMRAIMNEIFGKKNFRNEIIWWKNTFSQNKEDLFLKKHDNILFYTKSEKFYFAPQRIFNGKKLDRIQRGFWNSGDAYLVYDKEKFENYKRIHEEKGIFVEKRIVESFDEEPFTTCQDVIANIGIVNPKSKEWEDYDSQKPIELMERIIFSSSKKGDLVADFFMGSGSFIVAAVRNGRRYIGCDTNNKALSICKKRISEIGKEKNND